MGANETIRTSYPMPGSRESKVERRMSKVGAASWDGCELAILRPWTFDLGPSTSAHAAQKTRGQTLCLLTATVMFAWGCSWKGDRTNGRDPSASGAVWKLEPVRMRVDPSSRFVESNDTAVLEARIELLDEMGDSIKGVGTVRFELFAGDRMSEPAIGRRLYSWDVSLLTLVQQKQFYDSITRAYLFRLNLHDTTTANRATVLMATFTPVAGRRLEAHAFLSDDP